MRQQLTQHVATARALTDDEFIYRALPELWKRRRGTVMATPGAS